MRIIILEGIPKTGKTSTLNLVYNMLMSGGATSKNNRTVLGNPVQNDFSETVTYHNETVFFFTMGDYPKRLEVAIRNANHHNVSVFVCACSHFSPLLINALTMHRTVFISKTVSVIPIQQNVYNTGDAQTIFNLI